MAVLLALAPWQAQAGALEDCDRLAADPGVPLAAIDTPAALAACAAASEAAPDEPRLTHQHARALERAGETTAARRLYKWAAEDGYPPAALALARLGGAGPAAAEAQHAADPLGDYARAAGASPKALAAALGRDMALTARIAVARAPAAALSARAASAAELAALLRALLEKAAPDLQTRYGLCTLTPVGALALAGRALAAAPPPAPPTPEALDALAAEAGTPEAARPQLLAMARQWRDATTAAATEADAMMSDLAGAAVAFAPAHAAALAAELARFPHLVIETKHGESWARWNPALGEALQADHCSGVSPAQEIPEALRARLKVAVFAAEVPEGGGAPERRVLLAEEITLDTLAAGGAVLAFAENWGLTPPGARPARGEIAQTPLLIAGEMRRYGTALRLPRPPSAPAEAGEALGERLGAAAKALDGDADTVPAVVPAPERARRLWMEASVAGPLGETPPARWQAFDRDGDPYPLADAGGVYLPLMTAIGLAPLAGAAGPPELAGSGVDLGQLALTGAAHAAASFEPLRRAVFATIAPGEAAPVARGVGLLMARWEAVPPATADDTIGLRARAHMIRPPEPAAGPDPLETAARWAAASVAAERLVAAAGDAAAPAHDALALFAGARAGGGRILALTRVRDLEGWPLSDRARGLLAGRLAAGEILLAPERALAAGDDAGLAWWAASLGGGFVVDEFADGGHTAASERGLLHRINCFMARYVVAIGIATGGVTAMAGVVTGNDAAVKLGQEEVKIALKVDEERRKWGKIGEAACAISGAGGAPGGGGAP
jgi:hypothetical protein